MSEGHPAPSPLAAATQLARAPQPLQTFAALEGYHHIYTAKPTTLLATFLKAHAIQRVVADTAAYTALQPAQQQLLMQTNLVLLDTCDLTAVAEALQTNTLLYTTSVQEPFQTVPDLEALAEQASTFKASLLIDNTQTPLLTNLPTKSSAWHRHNSLLLGQSCAEGSLLTQQDLPLETPPAPPDQARLNSLPIRLRQHSGHAQAVADVLVGHPQVRAVYHAGLGTHPQFEEAAAAFPEGFGGCLALEVRQPEHFAQRLGRSWAQQTGFGTAYSSFCRSRIPEVWQLWLGLEDMADLLSELEAALE